MFSDRQLDQIRDDKKRFFWANSRSFSFASLGFSRVERELVASVYAFCRVTDDLVDEHLDEGADQIKRHVDDWLMTTRNAFEGAPSGLDWLDKLMQESSRRGVPFEIIELLVDGVRNDVNRGHVRTVNDLRNYCYYVASTVGVWMCYLFGVRDPWMLHRAEALGRAMQITNILRDVGEDLDRGRVYLPKEILDSYGLSQADLVEANKTGRLPAGYETLTRQLVKMADEDYELAWEAIPRLPDTFARAAAVASEVYRGIHKSIEANGYDNFTVRARTGTFSKIMLMLRALKRLWIERLKLSRRRTGLTADPSSDGNGRPPARSSILVLLAVQSLATGSAVAQVHTTVIDQVRQQYWGRPESKDIDSAQVLLRSDSGLPSDPIAVAYVAALEIVKAKHDLWPGTKLQHLNAGLPVLDSLVAVHPSLTEIRFLRLVSCYFLPSFLKRQWSVDEDVGELALLLPDARNQVPLGEYKQMLRFVLQNGQIGDADRRRLMAALETSYRESVDPSVSGKPVGPVSPAAANQESGR